MKKDVHAPKDQPQIKEQLAQLAQLTHEIVEDNLNLATALGRLRDGQEQVRSDLLREIGLLRDEFSGATSFRALRELCREIGPILTAIDALLEAEQPVEPEILTNHVASLSITLHRVLERLGAEQILVDIGSELFDPARHQCVALVQPENSPYPEAPPRSIVRVLEHGYTAGGKVITPSKVEVQAEQ
jgi:molecular chaperone GrpE (heat shock protein)